MWSLTEKRKGVKKEKGSSLLLTHVCCCINLLPCHPHCEPNILVPLPIMNRGLAYQDVFTDRSDRQIFLSLLAESYEMWGIQVLAYCFLDNHYHFLIQTPLAKLSQVRKLKAGTDGTCPL